MLHELFKSLIRFDPFSGHPNTGRGWPVTAAAPGPDGGRGHAETRRWGHASERNQATAGLCPSFADITAVADFTKKKKSF